MLLDSEDISAISNLISEYSLLIELRADGGRANTLY
jgi:hypothetical protein